MKKSIRLLPILWVMLPLCAHATDHEGEAVVATPAAAATTVECPALTKVKYPFLACEKDAYGQIVLAGAAEVLETSQMAPMDPYIDNPDYWGN